MVFFFRVFRESVSTIWIQIPGKLIVSFVYVASDWSKMCSLDFVGKFVYF